MRRILFPLALAALLCAPAFAQETVAKVMEIKPVTKGGTANMTYVRDAKNYPAYEAMDTKIKDVYQTDANTVAAIEFAIGGRVGINKNSKIEITSERSVKDGTNVKTIKITQGGMWAKCGKLKEPLRIQTNGGVMGIKGTEFVVDTQDGGNAQVSLLEGSVEVADNKGQVIGTMQPGDQWVLAAAAAPVRKHYEPDTLRENISNSPEWQNAWTALSIVSAFVPGGVPYAGGAMYAAANCDFEKDPVGSAAAIVNALPVNTGPVGGILGMASSMGAGRQSAKPNFPSAPFPNSFDGPDKGKVYSNPVTFRWDFDEADHYVVLVSPNEDFKAIEWSGKTKAKTLSYPPNAPPLRAGRHYWRVVPMDDEEKPEDGKRASQTWFDVK